MREKLNLLQIASNIVSLQGKYEDNKDLKNELQDLFDLVIKQQEIQIRLTNELKEIYLTMK